MVVTYKVQVNAFEPAPFVVQVDAGVQRFEDETPTGTNVITRLYEGVEVPMLTFSSQLIGLHPELFIKRYWVYVGPPPEGNLLDEFDLTMPPQNNLLLPEPTVDFQLHQTGEIPPPPPQPPPPPPQPVVIEEPPKPVIVEPLVPDEPPWEPWPPRPIEPPPGPWRPPDGVPPYRPPVGEPLKPIRPPGPRLALDAAIWNRFIQRYGDRIQRWALNVPLDYGDLPPGAEPHDKYAQLWARLTQHKADCFVDFGQVIYVCEIKPRLTLSALGQAFFGWQLALKRYRFDKVVRPAVICETAPRSLLAIAGQNSITVFVLETITESREGERE